MLLDRLDRVPQRLTSVPEVTVRHPLRRPVAYLLCNRQALRVVLELLGMVPQPPVRHPDVPAHRLLHRSVARLLCNCQVQLGVLDRLVCVPQCQIRNPEGVVDTCRVFWAMCPQGDCYLPARAIQRHHAPPVGSIGKLRDLPYHSFLGIQFRYRGTHRGHAAGRRMTRR